MNKETNIKEIWSIWEKMSLTKCLKWSNYRFKPSAIKNALTYMFISGTTENGDDEEVKELLESLKPFNKL